jgi:hypothetical protein
MAVNQFDAWSRGLKNAMDNLGGSTRAKAWFEVKRKENQILTEFDKLLQEFAITFMQEYFVNEVFKPAFFAGQGTGMGAGAASAINFMPKIELGYSQKTQSITYDRSKGKKKANYEQRIEEATASGDWTLVAKLQAEETTGIAERASNNRAASLAESALAAGQSMTGAWETGFGELFAAMTKLSSPQIGGSSVLIQMGSGSDILKQKLAPYSVSQNMASSSDFDSFFYAAEFGTGIAQNVGGAQWVREAKKNNAQNGPFKGPPGSWWFGNAATGGGLFSGQRGLHFLFDPATRQPLPIYRDWISKNIATKFAAFMSARSGGKFRLSR